MIKYRIYFTRDFLINKMQFDIKYSISEAICIIKCFRKVCSNGNELALHNVLETGDFFFNTSWLFIVTPNLFSSRFYILLWSSLISIFGLTFAHALKNKTLGIFFKLFSPVGFVLFSFPLRMYNITPNLKKRVNDNSEVHSEIIYNNTYTIYSKSLYLNSIALSFWPKS